MLYYLYIKLIGKIVGFAAKVCERIQDVTGSASIKLYEKALTIYEQQVQYLETRLR